MYKDSEKERDRERERERNSKIYVGRIYEFIA